MSYFAKGKFLYGSATNDELRSFSEASLQGRGTEAYCIDRYEYPGKGQTPRGMVSWQEAGILCRRRGKRLCSELEWERACKGESVYRYPYGNKFNVNRCNTRGPNHKNRLVKRTGSFPGCKNSFGVYDMSGNVAEWTLSSFYKGSTRRTIRGGSSNRPDWAVRCASRSSANPDVKKPTLGFRCCSKPLR